MGISACTVGVLLALLGSLVDFAASTANRGMERDDRLTVNIRKTPSEPIAEVTVTNIVTPTLRRAVIIDTEEPASDPRPPKDWRAIAQLAARTSVDDHIENAEARESLWRQSHSVLFESDGELVKPEDAAIISDLRFKPEIHVFGLGFTIGSCFIGVPLVGVPVEQRTADISIFVCAGDSG